MKKIEPRTYSGFRDRLPETMNHREFIRSKLRTVFEKYAFEPLETPAMELYEILTGKYGAEAENLIYRLAHKDGKTLALRYDLTVPLSRVIAMNFELVKPIFKRYQIQQVWRGERPQKGRYREFTQCDIDTIGSSSIFADAEIIALLNEMMTSLGFDRFEILVNNRKILDGTVKYAGVDGKLREVCRSIDKLSKIGVEKVRKELSAGEIPENSVDKIFEVLSIEGENSRSILSQLEKLLRQFSPAKEGLEELGQLLNYLELLEIPEANYKLDPSLARGLDYYTGTIFEVVLLDAKIGSVAGGGRWDSLIGHYTGKNMPAVGASFGLERLMEAMAQASLLPEMGSKIEVLIAPFNGEMVNNGISLLAKLRSGGFNSEIYPKAKGFRNALGYADRKGIPIVLMVAPEEWDSEEVVIRAMKSKTQITCSIDEVLRSIGNIL